MHSKIDFHWVISASITFCLLAFATFTTQLKRESSDKNSLRFQQRNMEDKATTTLKQLYNIAFYYFYRKWDRFCISDQAKIGMVQGRTVVG